MNRLTVFTPTYNRANTLDRVFDSLNNQTYKDFQWIIIDDGSTDNTSELVKEYKKKASYKIIYKWQENSGKHVAINRALDMCDTELFVIADSDDSFKDNALEVLVNTWDSIEDKDSYKGVICRCYDVETNKGIGIQFPKYIFDSNDVEAFFKYKLRYEKWMLFSTKVFKEFKFPEYKGLRFFPETVIWQQMGAKYKTRYIDEALRAYYRDQTNSVTKKSYNRYKENVHYWIHFINNEMKYFFYYPKVFIKSFVGYARDSKLNGFGFFESMKKINKFYKKVLYLIFYPVGYIMAHNTGGE